MKISDDSILAILAEAPAGGLRVSDVTRALELGGAHRRQVGEALQELVRSGRAARRGRRFGLPQTADEEQAPRATGILQVTPGGRGFVDLGEAYEDVLVAHRDLAGAIDGDTVEVQTWQGRSRRQGQVVRVLARGRSRLTGTLRRRSDGELYLEPDDQRLPAPVALSGAGGATVGQTVLASISAYPTGPDGQLQARLTRVLGEPGKLLTEVARSVAGAGVEEDFPPELEAEARALSSSRLLEDEPDRLDLRHLPFITIDPRTARDFDDAVALEDGPEGSLRVWVAVADVSHFVAEGSPLDVEARRRGCSLYLPDRAIHMLPEALSAGACSLAPHQDRLAMVVRMDVGPRGRVLRDDCAAAIVHSQGRLDYAGVASALAGDLSGSRAEYAEHRQLLERLQQLTGRLRQARLRRGSLDLDLPDSEVQLDQDDPGRVRDILESRPDAPVKRAYSMIEELMVAANEAVGRRLEAGQASAIWRIHPPPRPEALERLASWLKDYGIPVHAEELLQRKGMARAVKDIAAHRAHRALSYLLLRALKQALYAVDNVGHFGLASRTYLHFTSPIRRYPDLHVHRLLKRLLRQQGRPAGRPLELRQHAPAQLAAIARESSFAERRAVEVEREVRKLYAASLMRDRIGDQEWGTVVGLSAAGLFVALDEPAVEGMLPARTLEDPEFDPDRLRLLDPYQRRIYSLGDRLHVVVADTSVTRRQLTLALAPGPENHEPDPAMVPGDALRPPRGGRRPRSGKDRGRKPGFHRGRRKGGR